MNNFWYGKRALVTGAGGFIGSHLTETLANLGADVRAFVRYNSRNDPGLLSLLQLETLQMLEIIPGDLHDLEAVTAACKEMDIVFHLGALIAIPYSYVHPAEVVYTNILSTLNVLMAARSCQVSRVVHTSSSEVYGTALRTPIDEAHPLQGQSPYSASKIGADKIAESFYRSFDLPVVTLRPFNTYGPRQSARAVIPTIISQVLKKSEIYLGNLEASRDLTYVSDTVAGFLCAGEVEGIEGQTFNLGVGQEISIGRLAEEIIDLVGKPVSIHIDPQRIRPAKSEVQRLLSDNRLAKEHLGWQPKVELREGLRKTIEWISYNQSLFNPAEYQI